MTKTELYRHFGKSGELLYVGISNSTVARLQQHKIQSAWFDDVTRIEIERFASRTEALHAEAAAIRDERPQFNKNPGVRSSRFDPPDEQESKIGRVYHQDAWAPRYIVFYANKVMNQSDITMLDLKAFYGERRMDRCDDDDPPIPFDE